MSLELDHFVYIPSVLKTCKIKMASENVRQKLKQLLERVSNKDTF